MKLTDVVSMDLDELLENLSNKEISSKKTFCRIYHDLSYIIFNFNNDAETSYGIKNSQFHLVEDIEYVDRVYRKHYWRHFYFYLFHFIYSSYDGNAFCENEKFLVKNIEDNLEQDVDNYLNLNTERASIMENRILYKNDYLLFRINHYYLAVYKAFVDAKKEYVFLLEKGSNFNEVMDIKQLEKRLDIRKHETIYGNRVIMMYLTYGRNSKKSHATRVRRYKALVMKQQEETKQFSNDMARIVISNYYQSKHYDSKLKVEDFLETEEAFKVSRRTFFKYKKYYDMRFGKGNWDKNTEEKAYERYLVELEKNPDVKINAEFCRKINVGQQGLRAQIEKEKRRT